VLIWLAEALPTDVQVLIAADQVFGDCKLYQVLTEELRFNYLIHFRANIKVAAMGDGTRVGRSTGFARADERAFHAARR